MGTSTWKQRAWSRWLPALVIGLSLVAIGAGVALRWGRSETPVTPAELYQGETRALVIPAAGRIEPIEVRMHPGVPTHVQFAYPLWIRDVQRGAPWWVSFHGSDLWIDPPHEWGTDAEDGADARSKYTGYAEAVVKLSDGRSLKLELEEHPYRPDGLLTVSMPPQVVMVSPGLASTPVGAQPATQACEVERKQVESLTASTRDLSHAVAGLVEGRGAATYIARDSDSGTGLGEHKGRPMPHQALPNQAVAPCRGSERTLYGACWKGTDDSPPCPPDTFQEGQKCYVPVAANPQSPVSVPRMAPNPESP